MENIEKKLEEKLETNEEILQKFWKKEPIKIILDKTLWEKIFWWIKFVIRIFVIIMIVWTISSANNKKDFLAQPWDIESYYIWNFWENIDPIEWKKWVAWIKISWIIWNKWMKQWMSDWITSSEMIIQMLEIAKNDEEIDKIIIEINSPWWTVLDSEKIAKKIIEVKKEKKIFALMESVAASWGYYIASQCDKIFAYNETITGSIWVIIQIPNFEKLMEKIWVKYYSITSWEFKTMGSPFEEMDEKVKNIFKEMINESYETFVERIVNWRKMDKEKVLKLADWRIYSWKQAFENWLIDSNKWKEWVFEDLKKEYWEYNLILYWIKKSPFEEIFAPMWKTLNNFLWKASVSQKTQIMYIMN